MNPLLEQFLSEAREALEGIGEKLMQLESAPEDQALMTELFRLVHTLKGNSGLFEFPEMTRVLHAGEDLMDAVRRGELPYSQALADGLLDAMDFVGFLCDGIEAARPVDAAMAKSAVQLAQALRQLKGGAAGTNEGASADAMAPPAALAAAATETWVPVDAARLARVPEDVLQAAFQAAQAGSSLFWLRYVPSEECFFQGEDPLHQARNTPGLLWGGMSAREAWPALQEMDAYRCVLDFEVLTSASEDALRAHFRYVPEQITLQAVVRPALQVHGPVHASVPLLTPVAVATASDLGEEALQNLLEVQREILSLPNDAKWLVGRIKAAVACLGGCLRATGRADEVDALQVVATQALAMASAQPLADWMDVAFPLPQQEPMAKAGVAHAEAIAIAPAPPPVASESAEVDMKYGRRSEDTAAPKSLKVDQEKIDRLMNLIGEMVVAKNAIPYLASRAETVFGVRELSREIKTHYAVINRISEEMQDAIMQVRMMPVSFVFQRFPRLVRDTSRRLGKEVNLVFEGQDTAADKNIIESLGDPLVHMVRNSLDHGLESPEVRLAAGKPAIGTLKITARQESDRVLIEIRDDGRGIDPQLIKTKAYQKGLIDEQMLERISDQEAVNLVFAPGFSTADVVSDLSGRGVGMDVVRNAIERINGQIALESTKGQGTLIRLSLPLSMAVTTVMTVASDGQMFGVPMDMVVETVRVPRSQLRRIKQSTATVLRERIVPLKSLNSILGLAAPPLANDNDELATLVVRVGDTTLGLLVDDFHETADIILKPLGGVLSGMRSYSGSALMGDGSVLMVLNVKEMLQ